MIINKKFPEILEFNNKSFLIVRKADLEQGASGPVNVVVDIEGNNKSLKYIAAKIFDTNTDLDKRLFDTEVNILNKISQLKIIKHIASGGCKIIDDKGMKISKNCILMDYIPNYSLDYNICKLNDKKVNGLGEFNTKLLFYSFLEGIQYLHEKKIVHRDIKPDNIMLDLRETPKLVLIDFGHALEVKVEKDISKSKGLIKWGTPGFRPPEETTKGVEIKKKSSTINLYKFLKYDGMKYEPYSSDTFSLGITFLTSITGLFLFKYMENFIFEDKSQPNYYFLFIVNGKGKQFLEKIEEAISKPFSEEFKELFLNMVNVNPNLRPTIKEVINHKWFDEIRNMTQEQRTNALNKLKKLLQSFL